MVGITKAIISGSTDGKQILVVATATLGNTIHTASSTGTVDFITLTANNADTTTDVLLTLEWGGVTATDLVEVTLPKLTSAGDGEKIIVINKPLTNDLVVTAFASVASKIRISGDVNLVVS